MATLRKDYMSIGSHKWVKREIPENSVYIKEIRIFCSVCGREPSRSGIRECVPLNKLEAGEL